MKQSSVSHPFQFFIPLVIDPVEELSEMVSRARTYFNNFSSKARKATVKSIRNLRKEERAAKRAEYLFKQKLFSLDTTPETRFHYIHLAEIIGTIAGRIEHAGEIMRAMLEKR